MKSVKLQNYKVNGKYDEPNAVLVPVNIAIVPVPTQGLMVGALTRSADKHAIVYFKVFDGSMDGDVLQEGSVIFADYDAIGEETPATTDFSDIFTDNGDIDAQAIAGLRVHPDTAALMEGATDVG